MTLKRGNTVSITVSVVNYNQGRLLEACLQSLFEQTLPPERVIVVDNASTDGSADVLVGLRREVEVIRNDTNRGYAGGHNQAFRRSDTNLVMALNCDVALGPAFISSVVSALVASPKAGSACGRLYSGSPPQELTLDSTGLYPDRFRRFFDRGHLQSDRPHSGERQTIFGPSGSAAVYRKAMLDDVAYRGQYFDEDFFAYCEDADLAWRAQRLGWDSIYVPSAVGWHIHADLSRARSVRRDEDASFRQMLLIRNRHMCFLKNDEMPELLRDLIWIAGYDVALQAFLLACKPRLALGWPLSLMRSLPELSRKRQELFRRQRRSVQLQSWFDSPR